MDEELVEEMTFNTDCKIFLFFFWDSFVSFFKSVDHRIEYHFTSFGRESSWRRSDLLEEWEKWSNRQLLTLYRTEQMKPDKKNAFTQTQNNRDGPNRIECEPAKV